MVLVKSGETGELQKRVAGLIKWQNGMTIGIQKEFYYHSKGLMGDVWGESLPIYIYNIRTLSVNIKFICTSFRNRQNSEHLASFSGLFRSEYKWILYITTMYVYCVYPAMSKKVGKLVRFKQKGQKQALFLAFHKCCQGCLLRGPRYISTSFILVCALRCHIATGYQESLFV